MLLISAKVGPFKSINVPQNVMIDGTVTVLVGMNESGKTVFLQAIEKSNDALSIASFEPVDDYPRKDLPSYLKQHNVKPAEVTVLTYGLSNEDIAKLNDRFHTKVKPGFQFSVTHTYANKKLIGISLDEKPVVNSLVSTPSLKSSENNWFKISSATRYLSTPVNFCTYLSITLSVGTIKSILLPFIN